MKDCLNFWSSLPGSLFSPFQCSTSSFPSATKEANSNVVISITPGMVANLPVIDYRNRYLPICTHCGSYVSSFSRKHTNINAYSCGICGSLFTLPDGMSYESSEELRSSCYEVIEKTKMQKPVIPSYVFIIDRSNGEFSKALDRSILATLPTLPSNSRIFVIELSSSIRVFNPSKSRFYEICDYDHPELPPFTPGTVSSTESFISKGKILESFHAQLTIPQCLAAIDVAAHLLSDTGGQIVYSSSVSPSIPEEFQTFFRKHSIQLNGLLRGQFNLDFSNFIGSTGGFVNFFSEPFTIPPIPLTSFICSVVFSLKCADGVIPTSSIPFPLEKSNMVFVPYFSISSSIDFELIVMRPKSSAFQLRMGFLDPEGTKRTRVFNFGFCSSPDYSLVHLFNFAHKIKRYSYSILHPPAISKDTLLSELYGSPDFLVSRASDFISYPLSPSLSEGRSDSWGLLTKPWFEVILSFIPIIKFFPMKAAQICAILNDKFIHIYVLNDSNKDYLNAIFGQPSILDVLPRLETLESREIWDFVDFHLRFTPKEYSILISQCGDFSFTDRI